VAQRVCQRPGGEGRGISGAGVYLAGTAGEQFARKSKADATVGTGDEGDRVGDLHERLARPSALSPSARASCSDPTRVPATTLAVARGAAGSVERTKAMRRCTQTADAS